MRKWTGVLGVLLGAGLLAAVPLTGDEDTYELRPIPKMPTQYLTPNSHEESYFWTDRAGGVRGYGGSLEFKESKEEKTLPLVSAVKITRDGSKFFFDHNQDGRPDGRFKVSGKASPFSLILTYLDAPATPYQLQMVQFQEAMLWGNKWTFGDSSNPQGLSLVYRRACYRMGRIFGKKTCILIDDNSNGSFKDYGADAIIIGNGKRGTYLSKVMEIDGQLYNVEANEPGTQIKFTPYEGPVGKMKVTYEGKEQPDWLIFCTGNRDVDQIFIDCAGRTDEVLVPLDPPGKYRLDYGGIYDGDKKPWMYFVAVNPVKWLEIKEGETLEVKVGGPFQFSFLATQLGREVEVGNDFKIVGSLDEQYATFHPDPPQPELQIRDARGSIIYKKKMRRCPMNDQSYPQQVRMSGVIPFKETLRKGTPPYEVRLVDEIKLLGHVESEWK